MANHGKIRFRLCASDINRAIQELGARRKWYQEKCDELAKRLADIGVFLARMKIAEYDAIDSHTLISSVNRPEQVRPGVYRFTCFADNGNGENYAICVEYGTGITGADNPHPEADRSMYARGKTIHQNKDGEPGWYFPLDDGTWRWTTGYPARPFWHDMQQELPQYIRAAINQTFGW